MSELVVRHTAETFEEVYRGGYDKKYPSVDLVRLESWYFGDKPGSALDYGCGPGTNGLHLLDRGYKVVFADVAREALNRVEEKLVIRPDARSRATIRLIDPNATALPEADGTFDYIVGLSVLGNLGSADNVRHLLGEFCRVLKPAGKAILDINGEDTTYVHDASRKVGAQIYTTAPRKGFKSDEILMYFPESSDAFVALVKSAGFAVDDVGYSGFRYQDHDGYEYIVCAHKPA